LAIDSNGNAQVEVNGTVSTTETTPTTIGSGQKTVSVPGTAEAIASSTAILGVTITALRTNTGNIYVGGSSVDSATGDVLVRGDGKNYSIDDLVKIYIHADTAGEGVSFSYVS